MACDYSSLAEVAEHWATVTAIISGGAWALFRFDVFRRREASLLMNLSCASTPYGENLLLATMNATLKNTGAVEIRVRKKRNLAYPREPGADQYETLNYGASLLIRKIGGELKERQPVRWFDEPTSISPQDGDIQLDLASGYERNSKTDFWMEPGETYCLGTAVVLSPGLYLAMLTVVGDKSESDFWRSEYILKIGAEGSSRCVITPKKAP
jgi:hypothetical protein